MKKSIFLVLIGLIIGISITVMAGSYNAKQISFTPSDNSWNVHTVDDAIKYLYNSPSNLEIKSYHSRVPSGTTINVEVGSIIIIDSVVPGHASCATTLVSNMVGGRLANVDSWVGVHKATETNCVLTTEGGYDLSYIVIK